MATGPDGQPRSRAITDSPVEEVEIDCFVLADWAEAINGKLYIQGAGWDRTVLKPNQSADFFIAASFLVPWSLTNRQHEFAMSIESEDGVPVAPALTGAFTVGRPPDARPGQRFRSPIAVRCGMKFPGPGLYRVAMALNHTPTKSISFEAVESP